MKYHYCSVLIALLALVVSVQSAAPIATSATYQIKTATITGVEYKAAIFNAEFDQDLFVLDNFPCQCGVCSTNTIVNAPNESDFNFTVLNRDQWTEGTLIGQGSIRYYYFDIDSTQLCSHVTIELEVLHGFAGIIVATGRVPSLADYDWYRPVSGRRIFKLCNSNPQYGQGRFYMGVVVNFNNLYNRYKMRYVTSANPDCPPAQTLPSIPSEYPADFQWLQDSQATRGFAEPEVYQYYGFRIETQCTRFAVSIQKNSTLQGDADIYMSVDNKPLGYGQSLDPRRDWLSNNDGDDVISIYYCHDTSPPFTIFMAVTAFDVSVGYDIIATTQNDFVLWPLSGLELNSPNTHLSHSFRLECSSPDDTAVEEFFCEFPSYIDCYRDDGFYCCFPLYPLSAIDTPNPLWPWNAGDSSLSAFSNILWDDQDYNRTHQANRLSIALMMSQKDGNNFDLFVQTTELSNCKVIWTGQITNSQGEAILEELTFEPDDLDCTTSFTELVYSSTETINKMSQSIDYLELTKAHYELNFKFLLEDWYGCNNYIAQLGKTKDFTFAQENIQVCLHYPNTEAYNTDPCCNPELLIDQCCSSSSLSFVTLLLDVASESAIQASCATPSCSLKQFDNLIGIQRGIVDPETGCTATFRKEANTERYNSFLSFINGCQYNILGETLRGITCESDSECFSGVCNRTNGRCVQGNAELIDCLVSSIDESTARFMFNNWGLKENVTKEVFSQQLVNRYTMSNACVGPTGIDYRDHYLYGREELTCTDECTLDMETRCLDTSCSILVECDYQQSATCYRSYRLIKGDNAECLSDKTCNWLACEDPSSAQCQTDCETFVDPQFCGDCSSGSIPCTEAVGLDQSQCNQGICDIDGVALNLCTTTGVCDATCGGAECTIESDCIASGICSDVEIFADYLAEHSNATGVCLRPKTIGLNFVTSCEDNEIDSAVGCVVTDYLDEASCTSNDHTWWAWATDETSCSSFKICAQSIYTVNTNEFVTWKSKEQCDSCGGNFKDAFTWSSGQWRLGTVRPLVWMDREYISLNKYGESFDVIAFRNDVSSAIVSKLSTAYTTEAVCRYGGSVSALESLVCDCNSALNTGNCYADLDTSTLIGVLRACPYIGSSITAPPAKLTVFSNSISTSAFCNPIQLETSSIGFYTSDSGVALSSEIYNKRVPNDYSIVRNDLGGIVGQLISDGVSIAIDNSLLVAPVELCIEIRDEVSRADDYEVTAFGQLMPDDTIVVIDGEVSTPGGSVCARVYNGTYFVVARLDDWEDVQPYDELQASLKWVGLALYFVVVIFGVFQLVFVGLNYRSLIRGKQKIVFVSIVLGFNTLRGVYFALPVNSFKDFYIVQYLLFELPTFMFFTIYTIILYLWSGVLIKQSVLSKHKARGRLRRVKTVYIVVNAIMYAVFVLLVLLNQFLPQSQTDCKIGSAENANSTRFYIILSYQIFIAAVCFGVSLAFMIQGIQFIIIFRKAKMVNTSGSKDKRRNLITFIAVTCTALFIGRTIVFLYAAVTGNPVTIIIFVLFEVLPSLALLYYLRPYDWNSPFTTARNSSTDGNSRSRSSMHLSSTGSRSESVSAYQPSNVTTVDAARTRPGTIHTQKTPGTDPDAESEASVSGAQTNQDEEVYPVSDSESDSGTASANPEN